MKPETSFERSTARTGGFGRKLRDLRKSRNLTQTDLAARIGIQQSDLCRMETGQYRVRLDTFFKILGELDVPIGEFFQDEPGSHLNPEEAELVRTFRTMSAERQEEILRYADFLNNTPSGQRTRS